MVAILQYTLLLCIMFGVIFLFKQIPSSKMKLKEVTIQEQSNNFYNGKTSLK